MKRAVVLTGGHGAEAIFPALKQFGDVEITAVAHHLDRGGGSGALQKAYGSPPYGDITSHLACLSDNPRIADSLRHRYGNESDITALNTRKNILLFALEQLFHWDPERGLDWMHKICEVPPKHHACFATREVAELHAITANNEHLIGEDKIDNLGKRANFHPYRDKVIKLWLEPNRIHGYERVCDALKKADYIFIGPGSLLTSLCPFFLIEDIKAACMHSTANIIVIVNLMANHGDTDNMTVEEFADKIVAMVGRHCQRFIVNTTPLPRDIRERYAKENKGENRLSVLPRKSNSKLFDRYRRADLLEIRNGQARHNPFELAKEIQAIFDEGLLPYLL